MRHACRLQIRSSVQIQIDVSYRAAVNRFLFANFIIFSVITASKKIVVHFKMGGQQPAPRLLPRNAKRDERCLACDVFLRYTVLVARVVSSTVELLTSECMKVRLFARGFEDKPCYAVDLIRGGTKIVLPPGRVPILHYASVDAGGIYAYWNGQTCRFAPVYLKGHLELCNGGGIDL